MSLPLQEACTYGVGKGGLRERENDKDRNIYIVSIDYVYMAESMTKTRYPNLQTVFMVEKFIEDNNGEFKKTELFEKLPKKMMWQTFQIIMNYLESINKIILEKDGRVVYIWNPKFAAKFRYRPDLEA